MPVPPAGQVLPLDVLNTHSACVKASKEIAGLMLMTIKPDIQKNLEQLGRVQKNQKKKPHKAAKRNQGKGKAKMGYAPMPAPPFASISKNPPTPKKDNLMKDTIYHQCGEVGHWRRNCLEPKPGALSLYVGDGHRAAVEAIKEFHLYPKETMGYSSYYPPENKVFVAWNAEFLKNSLITQEASGSLEDLEIIQEEDTHPSIDTSLNHEEDDQEIDEPQSDINPIRKSSSTRRTPDRMCLHVDADEHELGDFSEPANYNAALLDPESDKWLDAMNVEMQSMKDNEVWDLVDLSSNSKTIGSKWLFKKKTDIDSALHTFKGRLVAKGFTQTYRVDYEETFSLFINIRSIRILITITLFYDYEIWQMDVKTIFSMDIFLKKSIWYNLKNKRFDDEIKKFDFSQNRDEPCVFMKASGSYVTFLILYVDDILIMRNNISILQDVKSYLGRCFAMKDLGEDVYILGIKIYQYRSKRLISFCQSAYIEKILKRCFMENSKSETIPMQENLKLSKSQGALTPAKKQRMQNVSYVSVVGLIIYAVRCTRPDVAFAHNITSRFQQNPGELHWTTVKNILKYLHNTKDMFLVYGDAEYIATFNASKEAVWIRKFISGHGVFPAIEEPINIVCSLVVMKGWYDAIIESDSQLAIYLASTKCYPSWSLVVAGDIKAWALYLNYLHFFWTPRTCSRVAHHVAKLAFNTDAYC
uniref:Reverse transcriptase Ty1/copia-type domain-containing protein n=1 Tax=Tanacetum cinerariifolium TaxID=118510 RepID=A0A6L2NF24_TANCI|nr:hypothetical protein [Tanacetum cinerariifolium]